MTDKYCLQMHPDSKLMDFTNQGYPLLGSPQTVPGMSPRHSLPTMHPSMKSSLSPSGVSLGQGGPLELTVNSMGQERKPAQNEGRRYSLPGNTTVKFLNFRTSENFAVIYLTFNKKRPNLRVFHQKDANGIANGEDPDQSAPRRAGSALFALTYLSENLGLLRYFSIARLGVVARPFTITCTCCRRTRDRQSHSFVKISHRIGGNRERSLIFREIVNDCQIKRF